MYILGVGPGLKLGHHDASAVLLKNNKIIAAIEEERFYNDKHARALFPVSAIKFCLEREKIKINDIQLIASPLITYSNYNLRLKNLFYFHFGFKPKIELHHHHLCHAASSFYMSGLSESLILTLDNSGDNSSGLLAVGKKNKLHPIEYFDRANSLGVFFSMLTQFLGFKAHNDEFKIMGLSAFGKPRYLREMNKIISFKNDFIKLNCNYDNRTVNKEIFSTEFASFQESLFSSAIVNLLGKHRLPSNNLTQRHKDVAASLQRHTEKLVISLIKSRIKEHNYKSICLAGGIFLNSKLNYEIIKSNSFKQVFIPPAAGDCGIALGAAILSSVNKFSKKIEKSNLLYSGHNYTNSEIKNELNKLNIPHKFIDCPEKMAAKLLKKNKIIGWFQGSSEWGPRALGNRSILANPKYGYNKNFINKYIKFRETFRPFGASILSEKQKDFFQSSRLDPFMNTLSYVRKSKWSEIPAVIHHDGTCRLQAVDKDLNKKFYSLLKMFFQETGNPVLLNTSLNLSGMPIASRLTEAIKTFYGSALKYLFLGNYMVTKDISYK